MSGVNASNKNQQSKIITESNHDATSHESILFQVKSKVVFIDFTRASSFHELTSRDGSQEKSTSRTGPAKYLQPILKC